MLSAVDALSSGLDDLYETTRRYDSKQEKERWRQDTRRCRKVHDSQALSDNLLSDEQHIVPQTLFPDLDDVMYNEPMSESLDHTIGSEPAELISMAKNYFRNTKPGHFQKKVLNAYLQRSALHILATRTFPPNSPTPPPPQRAPASGCR